MIEDRDMNPEESKAVRRIQRAVERILEDETELETINHKEISVILLAAALGAMHGAYMREGFTDKKAVKEILKDVETLFA